MKPNRFFDATPTPTPPADKITEVKNLIAEAQAVITEGKQVFLLVEDLIAALKAFLGK